MISIFVFKINCNEKARNVKAGFERGLSMVSRSMKEVDRKNINRVPR
jgi:hypothetical protein